VSDEFSVTRRSENILAQGPVCVRECTGRPSSGGRKEEVMRV